jgi:hypothetical protein
MRALIRLPSAQWLTTAAALSQPRRGRHRASRRRLGPARRAACERRERRRNRRRASPEEVQPPRLFPATSTGTMRGAREPAMLGVCAECPELRTRRPDRERIIRCVGSALDLGRSRRWRKVGLLGAGRFRANGGRSWRACTCGSIVHGAFLACMQRTETATKHHDHRKYTLHDAPLPESASTSQYGRCRPACQTVRGRPRPIA